jgi:Zn-dependent protease with chaperone function
MGSDLSTRVAGRLRNWSLVLAAGEIVYAAAFAGASALVLKGSSPAGPGKLASLAALGVTAAIWLAGHVAFLAPGEHRMMRLLAGTEADLRPWTAIRMSLYSGLVCLSLPVGIFLVAASAGPDAFGRFWLWMAPAVAIVLVSAAFLLGPSRRKTQPVDSEPVVREFQDFAAGQGYLSVWCELVPGVGQAGRSPAGYAGAFAHKPARVFLDPALQAELSGAARRALYAHELAHHACGHPLKSRLVSGGITLTGALGISWLAWSRMHASGVGSLPGVLGLGVFLLLLWEAAWSPLVLAWSRRQERQAHRRALEMTGDPEGYREAMARLRQRGSWPQASGASLLDSHPSYAQVLELIDDFGRNDPKEPMTLTDGSRCA